MKRKWIISSTITFFLGILLGGRLFFKKTYVKFNLSVEIPVETSFRPDAYVIFHNKMELESYFYLNENTKKYKRLLPDSTVYDFSEHSYCIVYGNKIQSMWYSCKTTYFDDKSAEYSKPKGKIPVFITYEPNEQVGSYVYMYEVEKNIKLRGFLGI